MEVLVIVALALAVASAGAVGAAGVAVSRRLAHSRDVVTTSIASITPVARDIRDSVLVMSAEATALSARIDALGTRRPDRSGTTTADHPGGRLTGGTDHRPPDRRPGQ